MVELKFKIGDDIKLRFTVKDPDENAIPLTGGTLKLKIAKNLNVADIDAEYYGEFTDFSGGDSDPTTGVHVEVIPNSETSTWTAGSYKIQWRFIDSTGSVVSEDIDDVLLIKNLVDNE